MNKVVEGLFKQEVYEGLIQDPKRLSSKWFYDKKGDELFVRIMGLPEYYLTRCEEEIFSNQTNLLIETLLNDFDEFQIYELGAGDGSKTKHLLKAIQGRKFVYRPIDISSNAIDSLRARFADELPEIEFDGMQGEYFQALSSIQSSKPKVILFMGSNIGNMLDDRAHDFLQKLSAIMNKGDKLLLGVDLKKATDIILPAYNDSEGVTAEFNLNLLDRINSELEGDFNRSNFKHTPEYNEATGIALSYLTSLEEQDVTVKKLNHTFHFKKNEKLFTEMSRKYDDEILENITSHTSLVLKTKIYDSKKYFCDAIYEKQ